MAIKPGKFLHVNQAVTLPLAALWYENGSRVAERERACAERSPNTEGAALLHLIDAIEDRRERPGFGYDFLFHSLARQPRFIEVKSVAKQREGHRFFLSDNEYSVSRSLEHQDSYYFYLVSFDGGGEPVELLPILAAKLYAKAEIAPSSYTVRFDFGHPSK